MAVKETIISKYVDNIASSADLLGNAKPSVLFCPLASLLRGLICSKGERMLSGVSMALRRLIHPIIMLLVSAFMDYKQVFESKNALLGINAPDEPLELPAESVIWCVNHCFKDDVAASIHATRHSYVYFGSLPHFYNTFDGLALFLNGVILCNRKIRRLKQASYELAVRSLKKGNDLTILPEGVWNKTSGKS